MKASEFGGADTTQTMGIQPAPHAVTAAEKLRLIYRQDDASPEVDLPPGFDPTVLE